VRRHVSSWQKPTPHSKAHPLLNRLNLAWWNGSQHRAGNKGSFGRLSIVGSASVLAASGANEQPHPVQPVPIKKPKGI
jgi:hypothetical protein